jgi:hypothetical protein
VRREQPERQPAKDREQSRVLGLEGVEAGQWHDQARREGGRPDAAVGANQQKHAQRGEQGVQQQEEHVSVVWAEGRHQQRAGVPGRRLRVGEEREAAVDAVRPERDPAIGPGGHELPGDRMMIELDVLLERTASAQQEGTPGEGDDPGEQRQARRCRAAARHPQRPIR